MHVVDDIRGFIHRDSRFVLKQLFSENENVSDTLTLNDWKQEQHIFHGSFTDD